ncbi:histidine phosphatase family protein [Paraflavisolibacter sp. H34]|uniref:SixA phosphatase family protein n=1 Tax=Huijunlia imazamoxiresistens TaxID=3127457 RepID=UPI00301AFA4F
MKTLIIVRHAKSSWADDTQDDRDRPLNDRGKKDAPEMAKRLKEKGIRPDLFLSSPAKRARKTARFFAEEFGGSKKEIVEEEKLYEAPSANFYEVLGQLDDKYETVVLFSHNPGITDFANTLDTVRIDDMPTCSMLAVQAHTGHWSAFRESEKEFLFFDYPKNAS